MTRSPQPRRPRLCTAAQPTPHEHEIENVLL